MLGQVDYSIEVPFLTKLNRDFQELCAETEQADKEENWGIYINNVCTIDNGAKELCYKGIINSVQWELLMRRYRL